MFGIQVNGCTDMYIGDHEFKISYLNDVPREFLTAILFALKEDKDFCVWVDLEHNARMKIISDYYDTYLIVNEELIMVKDFNKWQIAMEMYEDFRADFDAWCKWLCYNGDEEEMEKYPGSFMRLLDSLSAVLQKPRLYLKNTERFGNRQRKFYSELGLKKISDHRNKSS